MLSPTPRRILLAVTGLTPQIVTETLYALACRGADTWIPHEIHLITTATGANNARLNLLAGERWFHRLCEDYALPSIAFTPEHIHVLRDAEGRPLDDIRTQGDNTLAADVITETLRQLTADPASELHVSIAGGRKTMGYYLGYALSLYGRPQDRLSHVLVSDPFETNRDFYYPTPYEHPIHSRRGEKEITVDARNARVDLADIPFVMLRDGLPERLRTGQASFTRVVATANRGLQAPGLVLDVTRREAWADDEGLGLSETEFLILLWLAERAVRGERATDWSAQALAEEFLALAGQVLNTMSGAYERIEKAITERKAITIRCAKYFEPHKSRINGKLETVLGARAAERYQIVTAKDGERVTVFLPLKPEQITIQRT
ncbi:TIGR02584 family CRISPR-associated protein [Thiocapsa imhoffii]|uniref:TIGR02584 family CRISPR-associated protein n=1 Tax=Thiocapsa imhoffii TaxID=382777 RepID=A0A9X1B9P1_9GAMM|nr:CRISPR-associated ring nuclease Csm6 [Thiocapsa imhoffii]MBK1645216.1 TIGR02584 family CRISPR-associated protein [Thiocapsa imhoffii]